MLGIQNFAIWLDPDPCQIPTCQIQPDLDPNRILITWIPPDPDPDMSDPDSRIWI